MAKKRKSENAGLDEAERTMYTSFSNAANSLSQLYTQAQHQQKLAFQAGERHALEKLYQWILAQQQSDSGATAAEIFTYLQNELDCGGDDASMAAGPQYQTSCQQHNHSSVLNCQPGALGQVIAGEGARLRQSEQSKNNVLPNSLSSPVRRSLQTFQMAQGGYVSVNNVPQVASGERRFGFAMGPDHGSFHGGQVSSASQHAGLNSVASIPCHIGVPTRMYQEQPQQNRDANVYNENDSSMDMHADSPAGGFYQ